LLPQGGGDLPGARPLAGAGGGAVLHLDLEGLLDRALQGPHHLGQGDVGGRALEVVAAARAALGLHQPGALEILEDLLEVAQRDVLAAGDVAGLAGRLGLVLPVEGDVEDRADSVPRLGGQPHRTSKCLSGNGTIRSVPERPPACQGGPSAHGAGGSGGLGARRAALLAAPVRPDEADAGPVGAELAVLVVHIRLARRRRRGRRRSGRRNGWIRVRRRIRPGRGAGAGARRALGATHLAAVVLAEDPDARAVGAQLAPVVEGGAIAVVAG